MKVVTSIPFVLIAISIHCIFLFKRELLYKKESFQSLLLMSSIAFVFSYLTLLVDIPFFGEHFPMLRVPFMVLIIFYILKSIYFFIYDEDAVDTYGSMDFSEMKDGIFNALFWFLGLVVPMILTYKIL